MADQNLNKSKEFSNLGGILPIYFIPVSEINYIDDIINGLINQLNYTDPEFTPYYIATVPEKGKFSENQASRSKFNYKISVKYSKDEITTRNVLEIIDNQKLVILVPDSNGKYRVIGSLENPVYISSALDKGTSVSDLNAYDLVITWSSKYRAAFILPSGEALPNVPPCTPPTFYNNDNKIDLTIDFQDLEIFEFVMIQDYKILTVENDDGLSSTIKLHGTSTDYVLGEIISGGDRLDISVDIKGAINIKGSVL